MPLHRLVVILAVVVALAAATVAGVFAFAGQLPLSRMQGLAVLGLIALVASFAWRVFADRSTKNRDKT